MLAEKGKCQLLGPVSISIQLTMGVIVVGFLMVKRKYEHPRRKLIVWFYDVSKQIIGAMGIHFLNLALSVLKERRKLLFLSYGEDDTDQCDWYFLNLLMDTTVGIPVLWVVLTFLEKCLAKYSHVSNIESGNYFVDYQYGSKRKASTRAFLKQLAVFTTSLAIMKFCIFILLSYFPDLAYWFANLLLAWCDAWPNFQIFIVMFVSPIALNCFQYFVVDNIIKLPTHHLNKYNAENFEDYNVFDAENEDCTRSTSTYASIGV